MSVVRGTPRRRGRPPKVAVSTRGHSVSLIDTRRRRNVGTSDIGSKISRDNTICIGDEYQHWNDLKICQNIDTDEELARCLITSWETKESRRENKIQVGMATIRDFENFKSKMNKSSDEIIRFFLRLDTEPGQSVISISEDMAKIFESLKTSKNMDSNSLIGYLLDIHDRYTKNHNDITKNILNGIETRIRNAVHLEMLEFINDGSLKTKHGNRCLDDTSKPDGMSCSTLDLSQDNTKKRRRKSLPQRILVEQDDLSDSDIDSSLSHSVSSNSGGHLDSNNIGLVEDTEMLQYNYVMNTAAPTVNSTSQVTLVGNPPVSWTSSTETVHQTMVANSDQHVQIMHPINHTVPSVNLQQEKELEMKGIFRVGNYTVVKGTDGSLSCPLCEYKGASISRLRKHFTLHTGKAYRCNMCERSYTEEYKLKEHIQVKHEKSIHFKCQICSRDFTSKGGIKYHMKTVHKKDFTFWCEKCCKGFNYIKFYQAHMNKHNGPSNYKCNACSKEFTYLATLSMHRKSCLAIGTIDNLACEMCGETFQTDSDLKEHVKTEHCDVLRFRCYCGSEFRWRTALESHKLQCTTSQQIEANTTIKSDVEGLMGVVIDSVQSLCKNGYSNVTDEDVNKSTNVDFDDDSDGSVQITNIESNKKASDNVNEKSRSILSPSGKIHVCSFCAYRTHKLSHMKRHLSTHTGKKYKCHDCSKSFNELTKLRTHENSKHQGQARYKCDKCTRTFSSKGGIMYHQQTKHNNSYKYKCETCDRGFNTIQHYMGHKNTHTGVRPFVCEKCNIGFSYPSVLTSHKRVCKGTVDGLTDGGLDLYPCKDCKEKFAMPDALQQHVREVHGSILSSKYMCDCGEAFELHALYELHKSRCSRTDKSTEMILQTVDIEADTMETSAVVSTQVEDETFVQLTPEKFNSIICNQPVFPS
ncbi:hypothetical protein ACF0H5_017886 [Mactra antiquata]